MSQDVTKATAARKQKKKKTDASRKEGLKDLHVPVPLQEMLPECRPTERATGARCSVGSKCSATLGVRWPSAISDLCDRIRSDRIGAAHLITAHTDQRNQTVAPAAGTLPQSRLPMHTSPDCIHYIASPSLHLAWMRMPLCCVPPAIAVRLSQMAGRLHPTAWRV